MHASHSNAPPPDLRIVWTESVHPHEEHDSQRSDPLIEQFQTARVMINPPIVAPMGTSQFVILDGANRCHVFRHLEYPHILVQVTSYESGYCELSTWQHVVSHWDPDAFLNQLKQHDDIELFDGQDSTAIAHLRFRGGSVMALRSPVQATSDRNAVLRSIVSIYQRNAKLHRTAISEPEEIWLLFPEAIALVTFPKYSPADIIAAAKYNAYIPPGISRHIIHGRALRVNYPLENLRDPHTKLSEKNEALQSWIREKVANRRLRYYAEATYQFDE